MSVSFFKKTGPNTTAPVQVLVGLTRKGRLIPYLTVAALYTLLAYNSKPISYNLFAKTYNNFVRRKENSKYGWFL